MLLDVAMVFPRELMTCAVVFQLCRLGGHESARAPLCKLATCTRQIFLSKLKLLQTRQTGRKNKKQSRAEIGYD